MGYDPDRFAEEVISDLICIICSEVLEDPVECSKCQTNFCRACIDDWSARKAECPNRCALVLQAPHRFLKTTLGQLKIRCSNEGCEQVVNLEQLTQHETGQCGFRLMKCSNAGCSVALAANELQLHSPNCSFQMVSCDKCGLEQIISDIPSHDCIKSLSDLVRQLHSVNEAQQHRITSLEETLNVRVKNLANPNYIEHNATCSVCSAHPIANVKFRCRLCPDFQVCEGCVSSNHPHNDFVRMPYSGEHYEVRCDHCRVLPISDIRYKCTVCGDYGIV
jgi:hypothetical protein